LVAGWEFPWPVLPRPGRTACGRRARTRHRAATWLQRLAAASPLSAIGQVVAVVLNKHCVRYICAPPVDYKRQDESNETPGGSVAIYSLERLCDERRSVDHKRKGAVEA